MRKHEILHLLLFLGALCFLGSCSDSDKEYDPYDDDDYQVVQTDKEALGMVADVKTATITQYSRPSIVNDELIFGDSYKHSVYEFNKKGMATKQTDYRYIWQEDKYIARKNIQDEKVFANNNRLLEHTQKRYRLDTDSESVEYIYYYKCSYDNELKKWIHYYYQGESMQTLEPISKETYDNKYFEIFDPKSTASSASLSRAAEEQKVSDTTIKEVFEKDIKNNILLKYRIESTKLISSPLQKFIFNLETRDITYHDGTKSEKKKDEEITEKPTFVAERKDSSLNGKLKSITTKQYSNSTWDSKNEKAIPGDRYSTEIKKYSEMGYLVEKNINDLTTRYEVDAKGRITKQSRDDYFNEVNDTTIEYTDKQAIVSKYWYSKDYPTHITNKSTYTYDLTKDGFANDYSYQFYYPITNASSRTIVKDEDFKETPFLRQFRKEEKDKYDNPTTRVIVNQDINENGEVYNSTVIYHYQYEYEYY